MEKISDRSTSAGSGCMLAAPQRHGLLLLAAPPRGRDAGREAKADGVGERRGTLWGAGGRTKASSGALSRPFHASRMAKVGEGDERWIVREREDGANVNGWHWSEKNLTDWAKERLTELLSDLVVLDDSTGSCKVCKLEKMVGDVTVQARKQKKFPLYELEITLNWEGQLFDAEARRSRCVCACRALAACDGRGGSIRPFRVRRARRKSMRRAR